MTTVTSLEGLRKVCSALTPPERMRFGDGGAGSPLLSPTIASPSSAAFEDHAAKHHAALGAAYRFRLAGRTVRIARPPSDGVLEIDATPDLVGMEGLLRVKLSDYPTLPMVIPAGAAAEVEAASAARRLALEVVLLPEGDTLIGAACYSYPRSDAFLVHGRLVEAVLRDGPTGHLLARLRTPLYVAWLLELEARRTAPRLGPRVSVGRLRVMEGTVDDAELNAFSSGIGATLSGCYERALSGRPDLEGTLVLSMTLDRKGDLLASRTDIDGLHDGTTSGCVRDVLAAASLPRPRTARATLSVPLHFEK